MEDKKWYIRVHWAEDDGYALLHLTDKEASIVRDALSESVTVGGGYCGSCYLYDKCFDTKEDATAFIFDELK